MSDTPRICKHVHIVMGGRNDQHVEVGVSEIECHSLHVITTEDFEDQYDSKIKRICEDAEVERGLLIAIPTQDIFSEEVRKRDIPSRYWKGTTRRFRLKAEPNAGSWSTSQEEPT